MDRLQGTSGGWAGREHRRGGRGTENGRFVNQGLCLDFYEAARVVKHTVDKLPRSSPALGPSLL